MKFYEVTDTEFAAYGRVIEGFEEEKKQILAGLMETPLPEGTAYVPEEPILQSLPAAETASSNIYGGMPVQLGWCNGHNTKLNCLEYHRDSEINLSTEDIVLLLAKQDEIADGKLDTAKVKAFRIPAGVMVEIYATTLHFAPCHLDAEKGFRCLVILPKGTNLEKPEIRERGGDDALLWAANKWLIAHEETSQAAEGAYVGLVGKNLDIAVD